MMRNALAATAMLLLLFSAAQAFATPDPPQLQPSSGFANTQFTASVASPQQDTAYFIYEWSAEPDGTIMQAGTQGTFQCTKSLCPIPGKIGVRVKECDAAGACSQYSPKSLAEIVNAPPLAPTTSPAPLTPSLPNKTSTITCSGVSSLGLDPDSNLFANPITYYNWSDGANQLQFDSGTSFSCAASELCSKGKTIYVTAVAYDGLEFSPPSPAASVTIGNLAPEEPTELSITPSPAYKDDTLRVSASALDPDGESAILSYNWSVLYGGAWAQVSTSDSFNCNLNDKCFSGTPVQVSITACDASGACSPPATASTTIQGRWQGIVTAGIGIAILVIAIVYIVGTAFSLENLKAVAKDELYQVFATAALLALLSGVLYAGDKTLMNDISASLGAPEGTSLQSAARSVLTNNLDKLSNFSASVRLLITKVGNEASKSGYCTFLGIGYSTLNCSPLNSLRSPLGQLLSALFLGIADLNAQLIVLSLAEGPMMYMVLPFGVFLRSFRTSRQIGGAMIAIALGFFVVFPASVLLGEMMVQSSIAEGAPLAFLGGDAFLSGRTGISRLESPMFINATADSFECPSPFSSTKDEIADQAAKVNDKEFYSPLLFNVIIRTVFISALNIMITLTAIRWMASALGAEIDVSSLARMS